MGVILSFLGGLSPLVWVIAAGAILAGTNAYTALKVHEYTEYKYQSMLLKANARVVEKEKRVLVLDQKTLTKAIKDTEDRVRKQLEDERKLEETISRNPTLESSVCLADDELRQWNAQNGGFDVHDSPGRISGTKNMSGVLSSSEVGQSGGPVAEQGRNPPERN